MKTTTRVARVLTASAAAVLVAAAALADPPGGGDIGVHYDALGGAGSALGQPVGGEVRTPDARGAKVGFERGGIGWSPAAGPGGGAGTLLSAGGGPGGGPARRRAVRGARAAAARQSIRRSGITRQRYFAWSPHASGSIVAARSGALNVRRTSSVGT